MPQVSSLWNKTTYLQDVRIIRSSKITEYDISQANITMLHNSGMIDENLLMYLKNLPKIDREIYVGNMIRTDKRYYDAIANGILNAKKEFFHKNQITDNEVIRVVNDAVFVNRTTPIYQTVFGNVEFRAKNAYTTFVRLSNLVVLFNPLDGINLSIDIVGMSDEVLELHKDYFLNFIIQILYQIERAPIDSVLNTYNQFYQSYINRELPIEYYREFNARSQYRIQSINTIESWTLPSFQDIKLVDIGFNASILRELYAAIIDIWQRGNRGGLR